MFVYSVKAVKKLDVGTSSNQPVKAVKNFSIFLLCESYLSVKIRYNLEARL